MDPGKALIASLEIIKVLYETAELYRRLDTINSNFLNELAILNTLKDQIIKSRRMQGNQIVDNYVCDINKKLNKVKNIVQDIEHANFFKKIMYTKKIEKLTKQITILVKKLRLLLELKKDMMMSSKLDIANIIIDIPGREFWENNFGSENIQVNENIFFSALRFNTNLISTEITFLKKIINDDKDKFITAFEFQEWLDFFGDFSVVMRRTIESLLDTSEYDTYSWYYATITKNQIHNVLLEQPFIVRKHTTQKGVFIMNFYYEHILCNFFIRNHKNTFTLEKIPNMNPTELDIFSRIQIYTSPSLATIVNNIDSTVFHGESGFHKPNSWREERNKFADQEIIMNSSSQKSSNNIDDGKPAFLMSFFDGITDSLSSIDIPKIEIPDINISENVNSFVSFFNCVNKRK